MFSKYIYLSRQTSHIIFIFQSFKNNKQLHGENHINGNNIQLKYLIYPPIDYAIGFNYSSDQEMNLHQISRFLSADQYERLTFN
ncbi:unnamed protein product [Rotaria sp. Silwood1]|nr:unnamed protein product [Rotaria sp. Silwood1]CAF3682171.1 unnamed protein product [Rotaria sp. Silwood1]